MKNTKFQAVIMAGAMAASALSSVSVFAEQTTSEAETESVVESKEESTEGKFVLEYPEDMQELGYPGYPDHLSASWTGSDRESRILHRFI